MSACFLAWIYAFTAVCSQAIGIQCCSEGENKRIYTSVVCPGVSVSLRGNQGNAFVIAIRNKLGLCGICKDKRNVRMADNREARI